MNISPAFYRCKLIGLGLALLAVCPALHATVYFDNSAARPGSYSVSSGLSAQSFITDKSAGAFILNSVNVRLEAPSQVSGNFELLLYSSANGLPNTLLGTGSGTNSPAVAGTFVYTFSNVTLAPGTGYWVAIGYSSGSASIGWDAETGTTHVGNWTTGSGAFRNGNTWQKNSSPITQIMLIDATATLAPNTTLISPAGAQFTAAGGGKDITVESNMDWTTTTTPAWLHLSATSGSGNSTVTVTADPNLVNAARSTTFKLGGKVFSVMQAAAPLSTNLSTNTVNGNGTVDTQSLNVTSNGKWTVANKLTWVTITPKNGTGNATVSFDFALNPLTTPRSGNVTIGGQTVTITQAGGPSSITILATTQNVTAKSGSYKMTVNANIGWVVGSKPDWVASITPSSGNASAKAVTLTVKFNASDVVPVAARSGQIMLTDNGEGTVTANQTLNQAAAAAKTTLSLTTEKVAAAAGNYTLNVTSNANWTANVTTNSPWVNATPGSGSLNGTVTVNYEANDTTKVRTAKIVIGGVSHTLTQAKGPAAGPSIQSALASTGGSSADFSAPAEPDLVNVTNVTGSLLPYMIEPVSAKGATVHLEIRADAGWRAAGVPTWISLTPTKGNAGEIVLTIHVQANHTPNPRIGLFVVGQQTFLLTQDREAVNGG